MMEEQRSQNDPKDGPLSLDEALEEFGDYWVLKDDFDWDFVPPRALSPKARLPIIVRGMAIGISQVRIARRCGVHRRTLYTDRSGVDAVMLAEELLILQLEDIGKLSRFPDPKAMAMAMAFRDKLIQKLIPRKIVSEAKGRVDGRVEVKMIDVKEADILTIGFPVMDELLRREAQGAPDLGDQENPEEPVD